MEQVQLHLLLQEKIKFGLHPQLMVEKLGVVLERNDRFTLVEMIMNIRFLMLMLLVGVEVVAQQGVAEFVELQQY